MNKSLMNVLLCIFIAVVASCSGSNDPDVSGNNGIPTTGAGSHAFVVDVTGRKVYFSKGNLQYQASTNTWRFAENQYDVIGDGNANMSWSYSGWIDLFAWGTGKWPVSTCSGQFDWGINKISNASGKWRTLTANEWKYLLRVHSHTKATVCGITGFLLLPFDWETPEGIAITTNVQDYTINIYSPKQWEKLELAGAIFLPAAGYTFYSRGSTGSVRYLGLRGIYWTANDDDFWFDPDEHDITEYGYDIGRSAVRLVIDEKETIDVADLPGYNFVKEEEIKEDKALKVFQVNENGDKVRFAKGNLQYQPSSDTWCFAENQYDIIDMGSEDYISASISGWIDKFCWGTGDNPTWASSDYESYSFTDWGVNAISNGGNKPNQWRTLTSDEWKYIGRKNHYVPVTIGDVQGGMFLPYYSCHTDFPAAIELNAINYDTNKYNLNQWHIMEAAGAVFLPEGSRWMAYWSSSETSDGNGYYFGGLRYEPPFEGFGGYYYCIDYCSKTNQCFVRLVQDVK